jgi:hypothetical protein
MLAWLASSKVISERHEQKYKTDTRGEKSRLALRFCRCHAAADIFYHPTCVRARQAQLNFVLLNRHLQTRRPIDSRFQFKSSLFWRFWSRVTLYHHPHLCDSITRTRLQLNTCLCTCACFLALGHTDCVWHRYGVECVVVCNLLLTRRRPKHCMCTCVSDRSSHFCMGTPHAAQHSTAHPHRASRAARLQH